MIALKSVSMVLIDIFKSAPKTIGFVLSSRREASNSFANGQ